MGDKKTKKKGKKKSSGLFYKINLFVKSTLFGLILSLIHIVMTCFLLGEVLYLNMLPVKFFIPVCLVVLVLCAIAFLMAFGKKLRPVGKLISLVMIVVSMLGIYYVSGASAAIDGLSGANTKVDVINVYVMKADKAENITDAKDYTFGIMSVYDRNNTNKTLDKINAAVGKEVAVKEYEGYLQMVQGLYDGEVEAIVLNEAYVSQVTEDPAYASFESLTRVLHNESHETELDVDTDKAVSEKVFTMYLSGIDVEGSISKTSRSDVNIIAVINPDTRQVLLLSTPRDYYIPLSISDGVADKLTHAGIYGIDCSMDTLEMLYDVELDYYFRVNFTGFKDMIDALGGVEVYSDIAFRTSGGYKIVEGLNEMDGEKALSFVRERKKVAGGDNTRGKNQMQVIKAVIDKAASPAILNDFSALMESLEGSFETSLSSAQISELVRMQLDEGGSWNVVSYAVEGDSAMGYVYSMSQKVSITKPNYDTVELAKELIQMVYDGETISEEIIEQMKEEASSEDDDDFQSEDVQ